MEENLKSITEDGDGRNVLIRYEGGFFYDEITGDRYVLVHEELYEELEAIRKSLARTLGGRGLQS